MQSLHHITRRARRWRRFQRWLHAPAHQPIHKATVPEPLHFGRKQPHVLDIVRQYPEKQHDPKVQQQLQQVTTLNLDERSDVSDHMVETIAKLFPNLTSCSLQHCLRLTDASITALAQHCKHLKTLNLNHCKELTDKSFLKLSQGCHRLKHLSFQRCRQITDLGILAITEQPNALSTIDASQCDEITNFGFETCARKSITALALEGVHDITDQGLANGLKNSPHLRTLNLANMSKISGQSLQFLATHTPWLQSLNLHNVPDIDDLAVMQLAEQCQDLHDLNLGLASGITDRATKHLAMHCHHLRSLCITHNTHITDETLVALIESCPLEQLSLIHCTGITDHGIQMLRDRGRPLKHLDIRNCPNVSAHMKTAQRHHLGVRIFSDPMTQDSTSSQP